MKKSRKKKIRKVFGYHLVLDLYNCELDILGNIKKCYQFLDEMPNLMGTHKQSPPFIIFKKNTGICGWIPIVESGISIYTYIPSLFSSIDIYSCKKFDLEKIREITFKTFNPKNVKERYLIRGKKYIHPVDLLKARRLV